MAYSLLKVQVARNAEIGIEIEIHYKFISFVGFRPVRIIITLQVPILYEKLEVYGLINKKNNNRRRSMFFLPMWLCR